MKVLRSFILLSLPLFSQAADCADGTVSAYASGAEAEAFGASGANHCAQFCLPQMALQFMAGAAAGSCTEEGYNVLVESDKTVQPTGSPMPIAVTIFGMEGEDAAVSDECEEGSVVTFAAGEAAEAFGATSSDLCAEFCLPAAALGFVPGASAGTCGSMGYKTVVESTLSVDIPGSPVPLSVTLYSSKSSAISMWNDPQPSDFEGPCVDCEEYVTLSAEEKLERIWGKIMAYEYPELPTNWLHKRTNPTVSEVINNFPDKSRVNMIFDRVSDERPPNFPRMLHEYGSIAKIAFQPAPGNNFTGLYHDGNENGIIRVTFCAPFSGEETGQRVPFAFAAKFFRDGIHSSNIPTCEGPDRGWPGRDPKGFSVFEHPVHTTSIINPPIDDFFAHAQNQTGPLSIADNAWYSTEGTPVEDPKAPLIVHFFPNEKLNTKDAYEEDFRKELPALPINTTLYTAYTPVDEKGNPTICICHSTPDGNIPCFNWESLTGSCDLVELGSIVTRSRFVHSDYGDNGVLFKHYRSCQEDRKYCQYNQALPEEDSTFTKSSNRNGTCVSRRRVEAYDNVCPFLDGAVQGLELVDTVDYCSTPEEHSLEQMCPFAKALHPSFSAQGVPYPLSRDDHLRACSVSVVDTKSQTTVTKEFPLIGIGCCRVMGEFFDADTKDAALQSLCNMDECRQEFELAFPDVELETECAMVDPVMECKFEIQAGPSALPVDLGFVSDDCCSAARSHASGQDQGGEELNDICSDRSCIAAYDTLFQQGQAFANPGSSATLEEVCESIDNMEDSSVDGETPDSDTNADEQQGPSSSGAPKLLVGTMLMTVAMALFT